MQEWASQANKYEEIKNDGLWNKTLQLSVTLGMTHPFSAVRVREILKWGETTQYKNLKQNLSAIKTGSICPVCKKTVSASWAYCQQCGSKLK